MPLYGDQDKEQLSKYCKERRSITGYPAKFFSLNRGKNTDPLYNEPIPDRSGTTGFKYREMFQLVGTMVYQEKDNRSPSVREEGFIVEYDAEFHFARLEWEDKAGGYRPKEGDVIEAMNEVFDIVNAGKGGNVLDSVSHTEFKLVLRKRSKFDPRRKIS